MKRISDKIIEASFKFSFITHLNIWLASETWDICGFLYIACYISGEMLNVVLTTRNRQILPLSMKYEEVSWPKKCANKVPLDVCWELCDVTESCMYEFSGARGEGKERPGLRDGLLNLTLRLPKKQLTADWIAKRAGWTPCLLHTYTHTYTQHTHCLLHPSNYSAVTVAEYFGSTQVTVGRPLQQSRNTPLHHQDYLPIKARRTQLSFSKLVFALVSSLGKMWTEHEKKLIKLYTEIPYCEESQS